MINTFGYRKLKEFVDEYLSGLQRADEKYKFDKNLIIKHCINCLIKIGGDIYEKDLKPIEISINNHTGTMPETVGLIQGVWRCDHLFSSRLYRIPYGNNTSNIRNVDLNSSERLSENECNYNANCADSYYVSFPYIHTTFREGHILVDYNSLKLDEDGLILYPDYPEMEQALKDYVTYQLFFEPYLMDDINENKYERLEEKQLESIDAAKSKNAKLSKEQLITLLSKMNTRYNDFKFRRNRGYYGGNGRF